MTRRSRRTTRAAALLAALATSAATISAPGLPTAIATDADIAHHSNADRNLEAHSADHDDAEEGVDRFIVSVKEEMAPAAQIDPEGTIEDVLDDATESNGVTAEDVSATATGDIVVSTDKKLDAQQAKEFMEDLAAGDNVEYIEPDVRLTIASEPNDPRWDKLWGLHGEDGARVDRAWDYGLNGEGQVIAVIDNGIQKHPDLDDHILPGYDFVSDARTARDGDGRDNDPTDEGDWFRAGECQKTHGANSSWHGTHVAGTIAAIADNNTGITGVAHGARVQPIRALGKCGGNLSDITDAVVWAAGGHVPGVPDNPTPANIINMSLGGPGQCSRTYQKAIDKATAAGATVIVAAGNAGRNARGYQPASCNNVLVVAATGETGSKAYYSNYGDNVDLAAPGGDRATGDQILSTFNDGLTTPGKPNYDYLQGTSMATPLVSGVAAMIRQADDSLTPADIKRILKETTRELPGNCNGGCGTGLIDAEAAVREALGEDATPTPTEPTPAEPPREPTPEPAPKPQPAPKPTSTPAPAPKPTTTPAPAPKPTTTTPTTTPRPTTRPQPTYPRYRYPTYPTYPSYPRYRYPSYPYYPYNPYYPGRGYWNPYYGYNYGNYGGYYPRYYYTNRTLAPSRYIISYY
ncbi:S8 family peptidase [Corynebacterium aquilae]|uniref:S8 family peptidase n=1 Tax=Corynebacterium aquilae TaxID=203263 RepID=UPI000952B14A|nr:S8 family peptidase [Corynebacterium aquilae]